MVEAFNLTNVGYFVDTNQSPNYFLKSRYFNSDRSFYSILNGRPWMIDNGAYTGDFFPERLELWMKSLEGKDCSNLKFVVTPDFLGNFDATLALFYKYEKWLHGYGHPIAFVLQDGVRIDAIPWERFEALFIGGTDRLRYSGVVRKVIEQAHLRKKWVHLGRISSRKSLILGLLAKVDSGDSVGFVTDRETLLSAWRMVRHYEATGKIVIPRKRKT